MRSKKYISNGWLSVCLWVCEPASQIDQFNLAEGKEFIHFFRSIFTFTFLKTSKEKNRVEYRTHTMYLYKERKRNERFSM